MTPERDARWSRAAQVGMLMRAYRESCPLGDGRHGLTQAGLLERMSEVNVQYAERYSHVTVSRWESGSTLPTAERLRDFGKALNLAPTEVEGLMILAGFREDGGIIDERDFSRWMYAGSGTGAYPEARDGLAVDGAYAGSGGGAPANYPIPSSPVPDLGSIIRYLSFKLVLTGVCVAVIGYVMAAFGWNDAWMPVVYVMAAMCLVTAQGLLQRRRPHDLGEFYSTTVFFLLSTFLLQSAFTRMDTYGFYTVGDNAGTHIPYVLALEVNLGLASVAGLAFHLLRQWQYSGNQDRSNALRRGVAVVLPPTLFTYVLAVLISNVSLWVQLVMVLPPVAAVFMALLALRDPTVRLAPRDRRFFLITVVAAAGVLGSLGAAVVVAMYLMPNVPAVLPDHNWFTSWQIDYASLGYPEEEALDRLNRGFLWHGLATLGYLVFVVGLNLIADIRRIDRGEPAATVESPSRNFQRTLTI